jgi:malate/lactate dehydrogenase
VIADRADGLDSSEEELGLVRRVRATAPRAILLCAGLSHRELVERSVRELHIPRSRVLGSASEALVAAAIAIVALELDISPRDVALSVVGLPPRQIVVTWAAATVAGSPLTALIREPVRRQLAQKIAALWPVGPFAAASAACKTVEALSGSSRRPVTCFIAPDDSLGTRRRTVALPVKLGPDGIVEVMIPELSAGERVALDNAMLL